MAWSTYHPHRTRFHGYCGILRHWAAAGERSHLVDCETDRAGTNRNRTRLPDGTVREARRGERGEAWRSERSRFLPRESCELRRHIRSDKRQQQPLVAVLQGHGRMAATRRVRSLEQRALQ
jgi:hypothetical protein